MELTNERERRAYGGIGGPVVLILVGVLFLLRELDPRLGISRTWPVLLIVCGLLLLLRSVLPPRPPRGPEV